MAKGAEAPVSRVLDIVSIVFRFLVDVMLRMALRPIFGRLADGRFLAYERRYDFRVGRRRTTRVRLRDRYAILGLVHFWFGRGRSGYL